jgi:hypothetical protein
MMAYVWYILTLHCTQPPHAEATKLLCPHHESAGYMPSIYHDLSGQLFAALLNCNSESSTLGLSRVFNIFAKAISKRLAREVPEISKSVSAHALPAPSPKAAAA